MESQRAARLVSSYLDEAEKAAAREDWDGVERLVGLVTAIEPGNEDARMLSELMGHLTERPSRRSQSRNPSGAPRSETTQSRPARPAQPGFIGPAGAGRRTSPQGVSRSDAREHPGQLAGFGQRLGAWLVDSVIVWVLIVSLAVLANIPVDDSSPLFAIRIAALFGFPGLLLMQWMWEASGQSPGKGYVGIRVVDQRSGRSPGTAKGLGRLVAKYISGLPLFLGYLWAAWDREDQTWHDKLASTVVVRDW